MQRILFSWYAIPSQINHGLEGRAIDPTSVQNGVCHNTLRSQMWLKIPDFFHLKFFTYLDIQNPKPCPSFTDTGWQSVLYQLTRTRFKRNCKRNTCFGWRRIHVTLNSDNLLMISEKWYDKAFKKARSESILHMKVLTFWHTVLFYLPWSNVNQNTHPRAQIFLPSVAEPMSKFPNVCKNLSGGSILRIHNLV